MLLPHFARNGAAPVTTVMSLGDDACRFRVLETDDPLALYNDALK